MRHGFHGKLKMTNGNLVHTKDVDKQTFEQFKKNIDEGQYVEFYAEVQQDDGTLAQLAKLHAMVRELAIFTGVTFEDMKLLIKDKAGLCLEKNISGKEYFICKSFGDCSREELSLAISAAITIGEQVNHPVG